MPTDIAGIQKLTVPELKAHLTLLKVDCDGRKDILIQKLVSALALE
mgnify:CR=1 FL=1